MKPILSIMLFLTLGLTSGALALAGSSAQQGAVEFRYDILRNGIPIGDHQVVLQRDGEHLRASCRSRMDIRFFGFTVYRFRYDAEEVWDDAGLRTLSVRLDDDGEQSDIEGRREGERFRWTVDGEVNREEAMPVFPTNHWNPDIVAQDRVLNTLTGNMNRVSVQPSATPSDYGEAREFSFEGELRLVTRYDPVGTWLGMMFEGRDGSTIEYRCRNCDREDDLMTALRADFTSERDGPAQWRRTDR